MNSTAVSFLREDDNDENCYFLPDDTTLLVGDEDSIAAILEQDSAPDTKIATALAELGDEHDAAAVLDIAPLRPMVERDAPPPDALPRPLARLLELPDLLEMAQLTLNLTGDRTSSLELIATDADAATEMEDIVSGALGFGQTFLLATLEEEMGDSDDPLQQATLAYLQRISEHAFEVLQPQLNGDRLTLTYEPAPGDQDRGCFHAQQRCALGASGNWRRSRSRTAEHGNEQHAGSDPLVGESRSRHRTVSQCGWFR